MKTTEHTDDAGRKYFQIIRDKSVIARVYDAELAAIFAHAEELLSSAEDALCYVNLFGQLSVGRSSAEKVAEKLDRAISLAKGKAELAE